MEGSSANTIPAQAAESCAPLSFLQEGDIDIIPESTLRKISQGAMRNFILNTDDYLALGRLWEGLSKTFNAASISSSHRVAICNSVCGFLEAAWLSQDRNTHGFALSNDVWLSTLKTYWAQFAEGKTKPMRQVLTTLTKILKNHPKVDVAESISQCVVDEVISNLILVENRSRARALISSLELFLRKEAISMNKFSSAVEAWLVSNHDKWIPVLGNFCSALPIPTAKFLCSNTRVSCSHSDIAYHGMQVFTLAFLRHAVNPDITPVAGLLMTTMHRLFRHMPEAEPSFSGLCTFWVAPLRYIILQNLGALEAMSDHILYPLFQADATAFQSFTKTLPAQAFLASGTIPEVSTEEFSLLLSALQVAKELGLVHEYRSVQQQNQPLENTLVLDSRRVAMLIGHQQSSIRTSAMSLLITAPSTTRSLTAGSLEALRANLPFIHDDPDAHTRGDILSLIRRLIIRLRGGMSSSQKTGAYQPSSNISAPVEGLSTSAEARVSVEDQHCFLQWYVEFLQSELLPTASYQRHICALKSLDLVLRSGADKRINKAKLSKVGNEQVPWVRNVDIFSPGLFKALIDLFIDPFDDVRAMCLTILGLFPVDIIRGTTSVSPGLSLLSQISQALSRAEEIASRTSRADHADTVARLFFALFTLAQNGRNGKDSNATWYQNKAAIVETILSKLTEKIYRSAGQISSTLRDQPLHGYISALRYIVGTPHFYSLVCGSEDPMFRAWELFHEAIISLCEKIWTEIKDVLCVDSPEGHTEDTADDPILGPKDIMSYSWRALRESSLLLHSILANSTYAPQRGLERLSRDDFERIGKLSFTQLAELRHRGAFSAVSQTFITCCQGCGKSTNPVVASLPADWYQDALKIIDGQASKLTRRSAGLPALVAAIASSDPGGRLFRQVMNELLAIAQKPANADKHENLTKLPQVHAMNCLKDIFMSTKLKQTTEAFAMPGLIIAAASLDSSIWAVRNCGLMLFRALMLRMSRATMGSQGSRDRLNSEAGLRIPFKKYPGLIPVLKQLLESDVNTVGSAGTCRISSMPNPRTEQVFPALELISEKTPSAEDNRILSELVLPHTESHVWAIREQAARTFAILLNCQEEVISSIERLAHKQRDLDQNVLHGRLLCVKYSLRRFRAFTQGAPSDISEITVEVCKDIFKRIFSEARSPPAQAVLIDILNDTVEDGLGCGNDDRVVAFLDSITWDYGLHVVFNETLIPLSAAHATPLNRSYSLLRRSSGLTVLLSLLLGGSESQVPCSLIDHVSRVDPDDAQWILQECHRVAEGNRGLWTEMIKIYVYVLKQAHPESLMTTATSSLAEILACVLERGIAIMSQANIATIWRELASVPSQVSQMSAWGREIADANVRLHGCILAFQSTVGDRRSQDLQFRNSLEMWCLKLRFALQDETEFLTRYSAVISMKSFIMALHAGCPPTEAEPFLLDIYIILYDMLNDDDEELRDISAITASHVLASVQELPDGGRSPRVPVAASSSLALFLAKKYRGSQRLLYEAIQRLTGQKFTLSNPSPMISASTLLDEYLEGSTVLFEEEKQNLYIDEVREIDVWYNVLRQLSPKSDKLDTAISKEFPQWVSEGLLSLANATRPEASGGLLGFTSKPDVLIIGLRIIYAARVLLSTTTFARFDFDQRLIFSRATQLLEVGEAAWVHDKWLSCLRETIDGNQMS